MARVAVKKKVTRSRRTARAPEDEQIVLLRAIWNELKALNARADQTNEQLAKTNQRLDKTNKRVAKTNDRLNAIRDDLKQDFDSLQPSDESDTDAQAEHEEYSTRISRLERHVGIEPNE